MSIDDIVKLCVVRVIERSITKDIILGKITSENLKDDIRYMRLVSLTT